MTPAEIDAYINERIDEERRYLTKGILVCCVIGITLGLFVRCYGENMNAYLGYKLFLT